MHARRASLLAIPGIAMIASRAAIAAEDAGLVTLPSAHGLRATIDRFAAAVREAGWVVFTEIDHAAAARDAGLVLRPRSVILFGNPRAGTGAMREVPSLALDLPMRVLVWEDDAGRVQVTRSTGEDIARRVFARHGITIPPEARAATEAFLDQLHRQATR